MTEKNPASKTELDYSTMLVHQEACLPPAGNYPLLPPVFQNVKFSFSDPAAIEDLVKGQGTGYLYSRVSNPTVESLEKLLAKAQGKEDCLAVGSGIAAISMTLLSLLRAGDHVLYFLESYKPTRFLVGDVMAKFGVKSTLLSMRDLEGIKKNIIPGVTKIVFLESPTNPQLRVADLTAISGICSASGVLLALDNTFAGFHNHGQFDVDLYLHSLTKFASGHGDVMGGAIIGKKELISKIRRYTVELGPYLDPGVASQILKGMRTYNLRFARSCQTALALAKWLRDDPRVETVKYPGLTSDEDYKLAARQQSDFGTMIMFKLKKIDQNLSFMRKLSLFNLAPSLGSTESMIAPIDLFYASDLNDAQKITAGLPPGCLRLSIGLEHPNDLIADLDQAL